MTTAMAKSEKALQNFTNQELDLIKKTVARDATDQELSLFLYTASMRGLNPLTRQIHFVKRGGQGTIQTGIDGFRLIAERTGKYAPGTKPTNFEYDSRGNLLRATVFGIKIMNGQAFEFSATAKFNEYKVDSNQIWRKMPETMLEKCAEAKLLRKGFPEELSGLYTNEEMAQADNVITEFHEAEEPSQITPEFEQELEPEIDNKNPYAHFLEMCPEHGDSWKVNKFGKRYHNIVDNQFCNFNDQIKIILKARAEEANMNASKVNDWCKENYGNRTWSKLSEKEQVEALWEIDKLGEQKSSNLLIEEAKKLGAVEVDATEEE